MAAFHLAQVNVALPQAPLDTPELAEFVAALDVVNAAADAAEEFVGACRPTRATRRGSGRSGTTG